MRYLSHTPCTVNHRNVATHRILEAFKPHPKLAGRIWEGFNEVRVVWCLCDVWGMQVIYI